MSYVLICNHHYYPSPGNEDWVGVYSDLDEATRNYEEMADTRDPNTYSVSLVRVDGDDHMTLAPLLG